MNDAGRIGFVIKGAYNNTETYDFLDVVYYNNSSYVAKKLTVGNPPADHNEYWQALAKVPVSAVLGVKGNAENAYRTGNINLTAENIGAAKQSIYGNTTVSFGRKSGSVIGEGSFAFGDNVVASGAFSHAEGGDNDGEVIASGNRSHAEGEYTIAKGNHSHSEGAFTNAENFASHACGKYNKSMSTGGSVENQIGDAFVIGNGTGNGPYDINRSNALRVTYLGDVMGTKAFQSSGADYAEFIKPWADGNPDHEDRVGYFVTVKNGFLHKANEEDYIVGITSGNPSIVGNADEDYYWRYERDEFNRIVLEDVPETVQKTDEDGNPVFEGETHQPVMIETGKIIPNARMKLSKDYDPALQQNYIERKDRKEWDYVGMLGVLPVRDDGTCQPGQFCKCGKYGIATLAKTRGFDTYTVLERISENIVSVILK